METHAAGHRRGNNEYKSRNFFDEYGNALAGAVKANHQFQHPDGFTFYDPHQFRETAVELIREVTGGAGNAKIQAVGITSMAETGLLVDRSTGQPQSFLIPGLSLLAFLKRNG